MKYSVKRKFTPVEEEKKKELTTEDKFYWIKVATAIISALLGVLLFDLRGWWMFLYLACFMLIWPFFQSFVLFRLPYKKDKWDWKNILKTGIGAYFFIFMLISTVCFTLVNYTDYRDRLNNPADTYDVFFENDILYVADGQNGFMILNGTNQNNHPIIGQYKDPSFNATSIAIFDDIAIARNTQNSVYFFNISVQNSPEKLGSYELDDIITGVQLHKNYIFVTTNGSGLHVYSQDETYSEFSLVSNLFSSENLRNIVISDDIAYVTSFDDGLHVLNVTNPNSIINIKTVSVAGKSYDFKKNDEFGFIAAGENGVYYINTSIPENIVIDGNININEIYDTNVSIKEIAIDDFILCTLHGDKTIGIINVFDPNNPFNMTNSLVKFYGIGNDLEIYDHTIFNAEGSYGLVIKTIDSIISDQASTTVESSSISFGLWFVPISVFSVITVLILKKRKLR